MNHRKIGVILATLAATVATMIAGPVPTAQAASYTVSFSGVVVCDWGSDAVQGVWVSNADGTSKWASWWRFPNRSNAAFYYVTVTATRTDPSIRLDIGCGGTTSSWRRTLLTPNFRTGNGYTENRRCIGTQTAANRAVVCKPSPQPTTLSYNQGYPGYCTWGAYEKWKAWTGSYPNIGGNAIAMDDNARAKGYYVSSVPHAGSMVVFNTGTYGHVGWVTKVYRSGSTVVFDFVDMNGGSYWIDKNAAKTNLFGKWDTKTGKVWDPTIQSFIVAPS